LTADRRVIEEVLFKSEKRGLTYSFLFPKAKISQAKNPSRLNGTTLSASALTEPCLDLGTLLRKERNKVKSVEEF
jgi:hypothetical protein